MHRPQTKLLEWPPAAPFQFVRGRFASKAVTCSDVLKEARKLVQVGNFGDPLRKLVSRACELLDDIDEILVVLEPASGGREFGKTAMLHRQLEEIEAAIASQKRSQVTSSKTARNQE
jgi:hypothetical protein